MGIGIGLATVELGGRTPLKHIERLWKQERPQIERVSHDAVEEMRKKVAAKDVAGPKEQHSASDRSAIDEIIAKRPHQ